MNKDYILATNDLAFLQAAIDAENEKIQAYQDAADERLRLILLTEEALANRAKRVIELAEEEKEAALIEVDRLQGVCQTITAQFAKGVTAPKFCKQFNGVNTQQVNNTLIELGLLRRTDAGTVPTSYARDRYFIEKQDEHNGKLRSHSTLTLTGAKWLYRAYLSSKLPMKKTWNGSFVHVVFED